MKLEDGVKITKTKELKHVMLYIKRVSDKVTDTIEFNFVSIDTYPDRIELVRKRPMYNQDKKIVTTIHINKITHLMSNNDILFVWYLVDDNEFANFKKNKGVK